MEIFSICLSSRSSCCLVCCCSLLICVACRFRFLVLCHCQFAASSSPLPSSASAIRVDFVGSASDFIIFCVVYDLITRKIILLLYIHARTDARVCECASARVLLSAITIFI